MILLLAHEFLHQSFPVHRSLLLAAEPFAKRLVPGNPCGRRVLSDFRIPRQPLATAASALAVSFGTAVFGGMEQNPDRRG
jgi:hypothetical protein